MQKLFLALLCVALPVFASHGTTAGCGSKLGANHVQPYLESLQGLAALVGSDGVITGVNGRWAQFSQSRGLGISVGVPVETLCRNLPAPYVEAAPVLREQVARLVSGLASDGGNAFSYWLPFGETEVSDWYEVRVSVFLPFDDARILVQLVPLQDRNLKSTLDRQLTEQTSLLHTFGLHTWDYSTNLRRFVHVDEGAALLFERRAHDFVRDAAEKLALVHPDDRERVERLLRGEWDGRETVKVVYRLRLPDGSLRWIEERLARHPANPAGRIMGLVSDVTSRMEELAQQAAAERRDALALMAAGFAHDINNLLTVLGGTLEDLSDRFLPDEAGAHRARMEQTLASMAALTQNIARLGRKTPISIDVLDLEKPVREAVAMVHSTESGLSLDVEVTPDLAPARANAAEVQSIVINLLSNAIRARPADRELQLKVVVEQQVLARGHGNNLAAGQYIVVRIRDNGVGILPEHMSRLFDPYFTTNNSGRGTGLGLSVSYRLMEAFGGSILVESTRGEGSEFSLYFPAAPRPVVAAPLPTLTAGVTRSFGAPLEQLLAGVHILLVEDEEVIRKLLVKVLTMHGAEVVEADHGKKALEMYRARTKPFDVVLTDLKMPHMAGGEFVEHLRNVEKYEGRVMVMSGSAGLVGEENALPTRIQAIVNKPFTPNGLVGHIVKVMEDPNAQPQPEP